MKSLIEEASTITKAVEKAWVRAGKPAEFTVKVFEEPKYNFFGMTTKSAKVAIFFKATDTEKTHSSHDKKETKTHHRESQAKHTTSRSGHHNSNTRTAYNKNTTSQEHNESYQKNNSIRNQKDENRVYRDANKHENTPREQRRHNVSDTKEQFERRETRNERPNNAPLKNNDHTERRSYRDKKDRPQAVWSNEMADIAQGWLESMLTILDKREHLVQAKIVGPHLKFEFKEPLFADKDKEKLLFSSWAHLILATVGNKYKKDLRGLKVILSHIE